MMLYIENPTDATRKLLKLIKLSKLSKFVGYKISIQKSVAFLYTNNELSEREIKETIQFTIASERIKYLEINFILEQIETSRKIGMMIQRFHIYLHYIISYISAVYL